MKYAMILLFMCISLVGLKAQDTIVKVNGDKIIVKVREVTPSVVQYKKFSNPDGALYTINLSDIALIKYQNGDKEVYNNKPILNEPVEPNIVLGKEDYGLSDEEYFRKGLKDAYKYYNKYRDAGGATLLTSLLINGVIGLIPAIACSSTSPRAKNLGYPSQTLMDNPSYYKGYTEGARKKKSDKVWMNWAIGTIVSTSIIIIVAVN